MSQAVCDPEWKGDKDRQSALDQLRDWAPQVLFLIAQNQIGGELGHCVDVDIVDSAADRNPVDSIGGLGAVASTSYDSLPQTEVEEGQSVARHE